MDVQQKKFFTDLGVSKESPFFIHERTNLKIFVMFDPPHLIKCTRNNLKNYDIKLSNGQFAKWEHIEKLWKIDSSNILKMVPKLKAAHIFLPLGKKMSFVSNSNIVAFCSLWTTDSCFKSKFRCKCIKYR